MSSQSANTPVAPKAPGTATRQHAPYRWAILALAFLSQGTSTLAVSVVPPLAPLLQAELALTKAEIGLFSSAAIAGTWVVLLAGGYWAERFGVRRTMALSQLIGGSVLLTTALTGSFIQAVLVIFAVGASIGVAQPAASKAIMDWFATKERATAMGVKQTGYPLGGILMAATMPPLAFAYGWRFAISLVGLILIAGGILVALFYRNTAGETRPATRGVSLRLALGQLLRNPRLWVLSLVALLLVVPQMGLAAYLGLFFSDVVFAGTVPDAHSRFVAAGLFLAIAQAGGVVGRIFWGLVSDRLLGGRRMPGLALVAAIGAIVAIVLACLGPSPPGPVIAAVAFAAGVTMLGWNGLYHALAVESVAQGQAAMGIGLTLTIAQFGSLAGAPIFGFIVDVSGSYNIAWVSMGVFGMAGAVIAAMRSRNGG